MGHGVRANQGANARRIRHRGRITTLIFLRFVTKCEAISNSSSRSIEATCQRVRDCLRRHVITFRKGGIHNQHGMNHFTVLRRRLINFRHGNANVSHLFYLRVRRTIRAYLRFFLFLPNRFPNFLYLPYRCKRDRRRCCGRASRGSDFLLFRVWGGGGIILLLLQPLGGSGGW